MADGSRREHVLCETEYACYVCFLILHTAVGWSDGRDIRIVVYPLPFNGCRLLCSKLFILNLNIITLMRLDRVCVWVGLCWLGCLSFAYLYLYLLHSTFINVISSGAPPLLCIQHRRRNRITCVSCAITLVAAATAAREISMNIKFATKEKKTE